MRARNFCFPPRFYRSTSTIEPDPSTKPDGDFGTQNCTATVSRAETNLSTATAERTPSGAWIKSTLASYLIESSAIESHVHVNQFIEGTGAIRVSAATTSSTRGQLAPEAEIVAATRAKEKKNRIERVTICKCHRTITRAGI